MRMQPKPQTSPFSQPSAFSDASDEPLSLGSLGKKGHSAQPAPRLQYRQGRYPSLMEIWAAIAQTCSRNRVSICCAFSRHRSAVMRAALRRHSTGSGMQPLETTALQAGLKTMPLRIPPLPEIPPEEVLHSLPPPQNPGMTLP